VTCKAIILDYIGTLVEPHNYSLEASRIKLHTALHEAGLKTDIDRFMEAYKTAHEKYRKIRYEKLKEVTNTIWVSEALSNIGCKITINDPRLKTALNVFFQDFIDSFQLRPHAKKLLSKASENGKVGLISNFTYAPAIYASLRKFAINRYFNAVVISDSVGWRKPHRKIFEEALRKLQVTASEAVYVGDSPTEDIKGAKAVGLKTVFVPSKFYSVADLTKCCEKPDLIVADLLELCKNLP
jgi:HAD superfamily hydrolase (TIGR01549 family)